MADLEDLDYKSILDMSNDEAIDHLRAIRLSRRVPVKKAKKASKAKKKAIPKVTPEQAAELLKLLTKEANND